MFRGILTEAQQTVLELLSRVGEARSFYLAGGTALALHLGHRRSRDFDFFRGKDFLPQDLLSSLRETGTIRVLQEASGTLTVMLREVPTSFFRYDYPLLRPLHESPWGLSLADPEDIAVMKLAALAGRGSRKDFVDLTSTRGRSAARADFLPLPREVPRRLGGPLSPRQEPDLLRGRRG